MQAETAGIRACRTFHERLEKSLAQAKAGQTVALFEAELRIIARTASEHLTAALENPDPEMVLLAIRDVAWVHVCPASRSHFPTVMKVLDALGIRLLATTPRPPDGRWVLRIGSRGRLTLPEALLYELGWKQGDSLLWEEDEPGRLSVRKVIRVASGSHNEG